MKLFCLYESCTNNLPTGTVEFTEDECIMIVTSLSMLKLRRVEEYHAASHHAFMAGEDLTIINRSTYKLDEINKLIDKVMLKK